MNFLRVRETKIFNFKSARSLLSIFFVRAAKALFFPSSLVLELELIHTQKAQKQMMWAEVYARLMGGRGVGIIQQRRFAEYFPS
jgi:hypothetical protein